MSKDQNTSSSQEIIKEENKEPVEPPAINMDNYKGTILIVEDDRYNAIYLKEILSAFNFKVLHDEFGLEGIQTAINQHIDLVLMDIRLPDINGYEATRQIKKVKPNLNIIAQTAYASVADKQKALEAGCNDYLSKPIKRDELLSCLSAFFEPK